MPERKDLSSETARIRLNLIAGSETVAAPKVKGYSRREPMPPSSTSIRVRARLLEEMERKKLTQTDVAVFAGWSESKTSKALHGKTALALDDLDALARAVGLPLTEVVRDHGVEFCAEMTPTQLRLVNRLRQLPPDVTDSLIRVLEVNANTRVEERRAAPPRPKRGPRPR